jgi:hypothetical protein
MTLSRQKRIALVGKRGVEFVSREALFLSPGDDLYVADQQHI